MSKNKLFLTGLLSISLVLIMGLFVACPGPGSEGTDTPIDTPDPNVTVTFNTNGGTPAISPITLPKGESMGDKYPDDPEKEDYYFGGWFSGATRYTPETKINASVTLTAKWVSEDDADLVTVTFDVNGGGGTVASITVLEYGILGNKYPTTTHSDGIHEFAGWFYLLGDLLNEEEVTPSYEIWGNMTVKAKWVIPDVTVTFDTDGGTPATIPPVSVKKGTHIGAADFPAIPVKTGFVFRGWFKTDDTAHETRYYEDTIILGNTSLKAWWLDVSQVTTFTIHFNSNHDDTTGSVDANPKSITLPENDEKIETLPLPPTRSEGWGAGMVFDGWNTQADGSGDTVTADTAPFDGEVFAQWKFVAGTPQVVGDTLVHYAPAMLISGTANNNQGTWQSTNTENADGSVTYAGGAVRYKFPDFSADYDIDDYDFFTVYYVAKNAAGTETITGNALKQYSSANGFATRSGDGAPVLSPSGSLEFDIRDVASTEAVKGVAIQNISDTYADNLKQTNTIKWTKVVFTKGQRVQITFVTGTDQTLDPIRGVVGTPIGTLPVATAPSGQYLAAWKDTTDNTVTRTTIVTGAMTLTAEFRTLATATTWRVDFNSTNMFRLIGPDFGTVELFTGASYAGAPTGWSSSGYKFNMGTVGWENSQVCFKVTLPADTPLSAYTSVSARINAVAGSDNTYKQAGLVAGAPLPETFGGATPLGSSMEVSTSVNNRWTNNNAKTLTYTIDKTKAASLMGEIELCLYWHFPTATSPARSFEIYDVTFNP